MSDINQNECKDKAAYVSVQEARAAITQANWEYGEKRAHKLKPYLCKNCKLYHLATDYDEV